MTSSSSTSSMARITVLVAAIAGSTSMISTVIDEVKKAARCRRQGCPLPRVLAVSRLDSSGQLQTMRLVGVRAGRVEVGDNRGQSGHERGGLIGVKSGGGDSVHGAGGRYELAFEHDDRSVSIARKRRPSAASGTRAMRPSRSIRRSVFTIVGQDSGKSLKVCG